MNNWLRDQRAGLLLSNHILDYQVRRPAMSIDRGPRSEVTEPNAGLVIVVFKLLNCGWLKALNISTLSLN
jgi:hypothetical protein